MSNARWIRPGWWAALALALGVAASGSTLAAMGFAEEALPFRDPPGPSGQVAAGATDISTIHDDLTYYLALAAGFSPEDANTLRLWDQLTDSEILTGTAVYTNGQGGGFLPPVDPDDVCGPGTLKQLQAWPRWDDMTVSGSVTSRFGPLSPFFHFPHRTGPRAASEIDALHDWGWGDTDHLQAYEAYAWGGVTVMAASCRYTRTVTVQTTVSAGSLEAFAIYLHALADSYSHEDCLTQMDALGMPWGTHTTVSDPATDACLYHPRNYDASDVHGREFYTYTDSLRTEQAAQHIYGELAARSIRREGETLPLSLSTPISGSETLSDTLAVFVHRWTYDQPDERRAYLDSLLTKLAELERPAVMRIYLPRLER